ncbi:hybrid sensor histidine kinase/response regulator [Pseudomonas sp. PDM13]|uniref:hybrid sensor histidine kinase/response regulator n=1 Tax=Pseudomonas sp. PDM13 TaxID=2769255 RepID=UPI0021E0731A|nr:hybrid sensor histidine kinase/response regulator [Pseudomonas sp. PDM13]MCU9948300.1 ATP-binding protein [Pseudomonas sp. PDM13]
MIAPSSSAIDTERSQAVVRLVITSLATLYTAAVQLMGRMPEELAVPILVYNSLFLVVSFVLLMAIVRRPGNYPARRLFSMVHDYAGIGFSMGVGGAAMLPAYGLLLWVTVGNGLRFGSRYLAVSTLLALAALGVITLFNPYWQEQPYVVLTLVVTTIIVPAYVNILLGQTRRATEAESAANLAKSRFLAQASHDLRQPIHSISLFTACLRDADLGHEERQLVDSIDKSLHSVSQLFRSILDMYSLDGGKVVPRAQPVALAELLEDLVQQNAEAARWAGVRIRLRVARGLHVLSDPHLLATMVQNILSNALKYAPGKPLLIGCRRRGGRFVIHVHDQGRGIPPQHLENVFDEFYRVRQVRDKDIEGVGLGLAIVKRLAELMGLEIRIASRLGRGTSVSIGGLIASEAPRHAPLPARRAPLRMLDGLRVILIEDDGNVLRATATLLEKWGCIVEARPSLPPGDVQCDLVITDFDLDTELSGADCIDQVRARSGWKVPAVVITGHEVRRVQESVADPDIPILSKPIHPAELRSVLMALKLGMPEQAAAG